MYMSAYLGSVLVLWQILHLASADLICTCSCTAQENCSFPCDLQESEETVDEQTEDCGAAIPTEFVCHQFTTENDMLFVGVSWRPPGESSAKDIQAFRLNVYIPFRYFGLVKSYKFNIADSARKYLIEPMANLSLLCIYNETGDDQEIDFEILSLPTSVKPHCQPPASCSMNINVPEGSYRNSSRQWSATSVPACQLPVVSGESDVTTELAVAIPITFLILMVLACVIFLSKKGTRTSPKGAGGNSKGSKCSVHSISDGTDDSGFSTTFSETTINFLPLPYTSLESISKKMLDFNDYKV